MKLMNMHKNMTNIEIADLLRSVAAAYQIKNEKDSRFKVIAYERAADAVEHLSSEAKDLWDDNKLSEVPGIGESLAAHLDEIFHSGKSKHFEELMQDIPPAVFELIKIPGVGPKNGFKLATELHISEKNPILELKKKAKSNLIAQLEGFGEDSQNVILKGIEEFHNKGEARMLLPYALSIAQLVLDWLNKDPYVKRSDVLGSMRRKVSTIGDIDIAAATDKPEKTLEHFVKYPHMKRIVEKGEATATILIPPDLHVDLMVQKPESYGSLLQHFTGSKHHNIHLREIALKKGLSLSEYGIKQGTGDKEQGIKKYATEEEFYRALGMGWIPPELREDKGEIEAAQSNNLPQLVELKDIKGDLQIHSDFNIETSHDLGASSIEEIAEKADALGYEYVALTDHNPSQKGHSDKQILDLLKKKKDTIDRFNLQLNTKIFKHAFNSLEIDILPTGELPIPSEGLETLDFALVSIHSSFRLPKDEMTKRVLDALSYPKNKIFAHPTARKINEREGVELDWEKILEFCLRNDKWLEINADPMRLDLPDILVYDAVKLGVKMTLGTDAHHIDHMDNMQYGISVARRGWATNKNVVNTCTLQDFQKMLQYNIN